MSKPKKPYIYWRRGWFPAWYGFCPTKELYEKATKGSGLPDFEYEASSGLCTYYRDKEKDNRILVTISPNILYGEDKAVLAGILVHECVHVFESILRSMAEEQPSEEFRAYSTQAIFCELYSDISDYLNNFPAGALLSERKKLE